MKKILTALLLALMFGISVGVARAARNQMPLKKVAEWQFPASVKGRMDHLAIDIPGHRLFVVAEQAHEVLVFNLNTGECIHEIPVPHPHAVLVRDDLNRIYITDEGKGALDVFNGKTYKLENSVALKVDADSIGYDPITQDLYIVNGGDNAHESFTMLSVVNTTTERKLADIKIDGNTLEAMALQKPGDRLFLNNPAKNTVDVINRKTNKMVAAWPVTLGKDNSTMAIDNATHRLFVGCRSGQVVVFNTQTGKQLQALPIGRGSDDMMFNPASKRIYVVAGIAGQVDVYREVTPSHYQLLGKVSTAPGAKTGLLAAKVGRVYVSVPARESSTGAVYVYQVQ